MFFHPFTSLPYRSLYILFHSHPCLLDCLIPFHIHPLCCPSLRSPIPPLLSSLLPFPSNPPLSPLTFTKAIYHQLSLSSMHISLLPSFHCVCYSLSSLTWYFLSIKLLLLLFLAFFFVFPTNLFNPLPSSLLLVPLLFSLLPFLLFPFHLFVFLSSVVFSPFLSYPSMSLPSFNLPSLTWYSCPLLWVPSFSLLYFSFLLAFNLPLPSDPSLPYSSAFFLFVYLRTPYINYQPVLSSPRSLSSLHFFDHSFSLWFSSTSIPLSFPAISVHPFHTCLSYQLPSSNPLFTSPSLRLTS